MHDWCESIAQELESGRSVVMVTAIEVLGSAPCAPGSKLIVSSANVRGTVGGGNLEFLAIEQARKLASTDRDSLLLSLPLGPILSQCCGGRVKLLFEHLRPERAAWFAQAASQGGHFSTIIDPESYLREYSPNDSASLQSGREAGTLVSGRWVEPVRTQRRQVVIFGGGHIGKSLAHVLTQAPCDILVVDPRREFLEHFDPPVRVLAESSAAKIDRWWRPGSLAVIVTHNHELDYSWTRDLLVRGDFAWCGLIGSKTKRNRFLRRLRSDGLPEDRIDKLVCPIGLPGLNSKHPGMVALSTAAQLLPHLVETSPARAGQSCDCALPGIHLQTESV